MRLGPRYAGLVVAFAAAAVLFAGFASADGAEKSSLSDPDYGQPLQNMWTNYYLDVAGDRVVRERKGGNVLVWNRISDRDTQDWVFKDSGYITTRENACLTLSRGAKDRRGGNVVIAPCTGVNMQKWERAQGGTIKNKHNNQCLDISGALSGQKGSNVFTWTCDGSNRQRWACKRSCLHGGSLQDDKCRCKCTDYWQGHRCEKCTINCENGGRRKDKNCSCECDSPWTGKHCSECTRQCLNGGVLNEKTCTCTCQNPWIGITCEKCNRSCSNGGTLDERTCKCTCKKYWQGDECRDKKYETEEVDGRDNSDAISWIVRYIDQQRTKCQPEGLPPLGDYEKISLRVHRDLKYQVHSYKLLFLVSTTEVHVHFSTASDSGSALTVHSISPDPCHMVADAGEYVEQSKEDIQAGSIPQAVEFIMKELNAKRRACELPDLGEYTIDSVQTKVVQGVMFYVEVTFSGEKKASIVLTENIHGVKKIDSVSPPACKIGSELTQIVASSDPNQVVRLIEEDEEVSGSHWSVARGSTMGWEGSNDLEFLETSSKVEKELKNEQIIPPVFDARSYWNECWSSYDVAEQGRCAASYAFATTTALSHRLCVKSHGVKNTILSARQAMDCNRDFRVGQQQFQIGCDGGSVLEAFKYYIQKHGAVSAECFPYFKEDYEKSAAKQINPNGITEGSLAICPMHKLDSCVQYEVDPHTLTIAPRLDVDAIKRGIMDGGAVVSSVHVDEDSSFVLLRDQVYSSSFDKANEHSFGEQAVVIVGWDREPNNGTEYWIVENSWGYDWGEHGYGKVALGVNTGGIEEKVIWADMALDKRCSKHCFNGGVRDPSTCNCRCTPGWGGDDCKTPSDCPCSICGPGYECGGQGDCPTTMNWCRVGSDGKMMFLSEDESVGSVLDVTEGLTKAERGLRGSKFVKNCASGYSVCLLK